MCSSLMKKYMQDAKKMFGVYQQKRGCVTFCTYKKLLKLFYYHTLNSFDCTVKITTGSRFIVILASPCSMTLSIHFLTLQRSITRNTVAFLKAWIPYTLTRKCYQGLCEMRVVSELIVLHPSKFKKTSLSHSA